MRKIEDIHTRGALVRETRKQQGLTQEQLAAACGVGIRFLRDIERGKETCQVGKVIHILQMLGIDIFAKKRGTKK